jgi:predicted HicB family RNase H-like nuclease
MSYGAKAEQQTRQRRQRNDYKGERSVISTRVSVDVREAIVRAAKLRELSISEWVALVLEEAASPANRG